MSTFLTDFNYLCDLFETLKYSALQSELNKNLWHPVFTVSHRYVESLHKWLGHADAMMLWHSSLKCLLNSFAAETNEC